MSDSSGSKHLAEPSRHLQNLRETAARLRERSDILEDDLGVGALKAEQQAWGIERLRLERELEVKDNTVNDLARDLRLSKDAEVKAIIRYDKAVQYCKEVEEKTEELRRKCEEEREECLGRVREFKGELEGIRERNEVLVAESGELGFRLRGKEGEVCELERKCGELERELEGVRKQNEVLEAMNEELKFMLRGKEGEVCDLERICGEYEVELKKLKELKVRNERDEVVEDLLSRIEVLEDELVKIMKDKDGRIAELVKQKEGLERENKEILEHYKVVEESFFTLERDVVSNLFSSAKQNDKLRSSRIGKILSPIVDALDEEQDLGVDVEGEAKIGVDLEEGPGFANHANVMNCSTESLVIKSEKPAKTTVISEEELSGVTGVLCDQKRPSRAYIQISDSEDDEIPCHTSRVKRKRASSVCSIQKPSGVSSSDDRLNPKLKVKKLEHVLGKPAKLGQPIAASDCQSDHTFNTPQKKKVAAIRECRENLSKKVKTPGSEGSDGKDVCRSKKTDVLEYMAKCQQNLEKNVMGCVADMALACDKDAEFCLKAVSALYRNGLLCSGQKGFGDRDIDSATAHSATAVAKYLVHCDQNSIKKKSADELKQLNPTGLDSCRKLARGFSVKLFEIFKSNKDPLFSHVSTDMQYR
ncbi:hypothetical protein vseg_003641 [Gypsophila vaccaria]